MSFDMPFIILLNGLYTVFELSVCANFSYISSYNTRDDTERSPSFRVQVLTTRLKNKTVRLCESTNVGTAEILCIFERSRYSARTVD